MTDLTRQKAELIETQFQLSQEGQLANFGWDDADLIFGHFQPGQGYQIADFGHYLLMEIDRSQHPDLASLPAVIWLTHIWEEQFVNSSEANNLSDRLNEGSQDALPATRKFHQSEE